MVTIGYSNGQQIVNNNTVHLVDLPDHLKNEHVCQIIYNLIKSEAITTSGLLTTVFLVSTENNAWGVPAVAQRK